MKIYRKEYWEGKIQLQYYCPGCKQVHGISPSVHSFNDDMDKPTFSPSLLNNHDHSRICHSFMKDGNLQFLSDCYHELKGQTVPVPDFPEELMD